MQALLNGWKEMELYKLDDTSFMRIPLLVVVISFASVLFFNSLIQVVTATVAGPEYCPPSTYFDSKLGDCLYKDDRGDNPDGSLCGLEGCYSSDGKFLYLSPFHPINAAQRCAANEYYDYDVDECVAAYSRVESTENRNETNDLIEIKFTQIGSGSVVPSRLDINSDSFTFKVNDGTSDSNIATVYITFQP